MSRFNGKDGHHQFERYWYQIVLAWALSVHKVQGISLDKAVIDLGNDVFDQGQAYVALVKSGGWRVSCQLACLASFDKHKGCLHDKYERFGWMSNYLTIVH